MLNILISFKKHSGIYTLEAEQKLPITLKEAWDFFSTPKNLVNITPSHMGFKITSGDPTEMYEGQIITYVVGILPGVKSNWVTEITHVNEPFFFVDEQRFGPYTMWHHQHSFEETEGGIIARDKVTYKIPFGPLGYLANGLFIQDQLRSIFTYRAETLNEIFKS